MSRVDHLSEQLAAALVDEGQEPPFTVTITVEDMKGTP